MVELFKRVKHGEKSRKEQLKNMMKLEGKYYCKKHKLEIIEWYYNGSGVDFVVKDSEDNYQLLSFRAVNVKETTWAKVWSKPQQKMVNTKKREHNISKHILFIYTKPKYKYVKTIEKDMTLIDSF